MLGGGELFSGVEVEDKWEEENRGGRDVKVVCWVLECFSGSLDLIFKGI